jgi:OOP family OmpA-OmpF porin
MKLTAYAALLISLVLVTVSQVAQAQDTYVALSVGQAQVRNACEGFPGSCDDKATGFKAFVGYNFSPNIGAEIGYVDFGKISASGLGVTLDAKSYALGASVVGNLPFDAFSLFGKAGGYYSNTKLDASGPRGSLSGSGSKFVPELGIGARYSFSKQFAVRVEFERFFGIGDFDVSGSAGTAHLDKGDVDMLSAGIEFHF